MIDPSFVFAWIHFLCLDQGNFTIDIRYICAVSNTCNRSYLLYLVKIPILIKSLNY